MVLVQVIIRLFEVLRYLFAAVAFYLAYLPTTTPSDALRYLVVFLVIPMAGLTALESLCCSNATAGAKNREVGSAYQIQSGLNNLSTAVTALFVLYFNLGTQAQLTVLMVMLFFLLFS